MTNPKSPADSLENFFTALAEDEATARDDETTAPEPAVKERAERLRALMLDSVKRVKLDRRARAELQHRENLDRLARSSLSLPSTPQERRKLLDKALQHRPDIREMTVQHRDFSELSEGDVESLLRQLHDLGALGDDDGSEGGSST